MSVFPIAVRIGLFVLVVECIIMISFTALPVSVRAFAEINYWFFPIIDATLLTLITSPLIYYHAIRPFVLAKNQAVELLQEKNKQLTDAQRVGRLGSWQYNLKDNIIDWSEEVFNIFEIDPTDGTPSYEEFLNFIHPFDREAVDKAYADSISLGTLYDVTYRIVTRNNVIKFVHERCKTSQDSSGRPYISFGTIQDISERMAIETAKSEFISIVSHELRTPLTSIKGAIGLVRAGATGEISAKSRDILDIAYNNSGRLEKLINDILDLEKIGSGKMTFEMLTIDLAMLIWETTHTNKGYADKYGITFNVSGVDTAALVYGDKDRLMQVMDNLLSNAVKFSREGDRVDITLSPEESMYVIAVKDYGNGIPVSAQPTIFEKFTQADSSDQRKKGGTGLGLSIAKAIVERHDGAVWFTSEANAGTTFFVELPMLSYK